MALFSNTSIYGTANVNSTLAVTAGIPSTSPTTGSVIVTGGAGVSGNVSATTVFSNNVDILNFAQAASAKANTNSTAQTIIQGVDATQNTNITATNTMTGSAYGQANTLTTLAQAAFTTSNTATGNLNALNIISGSVLLNGSSQYLNVPSTSAFAFGTGDFTVELWFNLTTLASNNVSGNETSSFLFDFRNGPNAAVGTLLLNSGISYKLTYTNGTAGIDSTSIPSAGQWNHVAISRQSGTTRMFLNGVLQNSYSDAVSYVAAPVFIGTCSDVAGPTGTGAYLRFTKGYISNFRVVKGTAVYTSAFTPSTAPLTAITNTSLLTAQSSSTITDASTNAFTITNNGTAVASPLSPFNGTESTQNTNITATNTMATAAYAKANTGTTLAQAAFTAANSTVSVAGSTATWTTPALINGSSTSAYMQSVAVNSSGKFVAVGYSGALAPLYATSTNGTTWTTPTAMNGTIEQTKIQGVAVNSSGKFVAIGRAGNGAFVGSPMYATSTDGSTWTTPAQMNGSSAQVTMNSIAVNSSGLFVAVGFDNVNAGVYATSTDGSTWTTPERINGNAIQAKMRSVAYSSTLNKFVAVGHGGGSLNLPFFATSTDGSTWTTAASMNGSSTIAYMNSVAVNSSGKFVAVGQNSSGAAVYATSTNGTTWTTPATMNGSGTSASMYSLTVTSSGVFVAVGYDVNNYPVFATSTDGSAWTTPAIINGSSTYARMQSIAVSSFGQFAAVGEDVNNAGLFANATLAAAGVLANAYNQANTATTLAQGAYNAANTGISGINVINDTGSSGPVELTVTNTGNATASSLSPSGAAGSVLFNGSNKLTVPDSTNFDLGSTYTIEAWIYPTGPDGNNNQIFGRWYTATPGAGYFMNFFSGQLKFGINTAVRYNDFATGAAIPKNTWTHVAVVCGPNYKEFYVNGSSRGYYANDNTITSAAGLNMNISIGEGFQGNISNLRVVKGTAIAGGGYPSGTLTAIPGTVLLACQSPTVISASGGITDTLKIGVNTTQNNSITAVNTFATSAYGQANTETTLAQAAYNAANTIPAMITNAQGVDATQNTNITAMNTFAAGAYAQANTGTTLAQAAFNTANSTVSVASATPIFSPLKGIEGTTIQSQYVMAAAVNSSGRIVGVGFGTYVTSTDGINWTLPTNLGAGGGYMKGIAVSSSGRWVAVGQLNYSTSTDGINWTTPARINASGTYDMSAIAVNSSGKFVAVGNDSAGFAVYATSTDGTTWSTVSAMNGNKTTIRSIAFGGQGSQFVAIGSDSAGKPVAILSSSDGASWGTEKLMLNIPYYTFYSIAIKSTGYTYVAVGWSPTGVAVYGTSTDGGYSWTVSPMSSTSVSCQMQTVTVNSSGLFVAVGQGSSFVPIISTSSDGYTWTTPSTPASMQGSETAFQVTILANPSGQFNIVGHNMSARPIYAVGSSSVSGVLSGAYTQANTATSLAQGAFTAANTNIAAATVIQGVNDTQNNSINAVNTFATSAYGQANTATAASVYNQGVDATQNTNITAVNTFANAAYASANTKLPLAGSYTGVAGGPIGGSALFSGTNYLSLNTNTGSNFSFGTSNFTTEFWFKSSATTQYSSFVSVENYSTGWTILMNTTAGDGKIVVYDSGLGSPVNTSSSGGYNNNAWHHVAWVRNGTNSSLYIDGVNVSSATIAASAASANTFDYSVIIGNSSFPNRYLNGYISNFRIVKGTAVYTSAFTPPTAPLTAITGTSFLTAQSSSTITDASPSALAMAYVPAGSVPASVTSPFTSTGYTLTYPVTGNLTINKDLQISGNLTSTGAVTSLNAVSTEVSDSLVELARNNTTGDTSDIGFAAQSNDGTTTSYSGVIRDAATKEFYVYQGYTGAVTGNNVDSTDASFAKGTLNAKQLKGSLIASSAIINGRELGTYTSTVYAQSNTTTTLAQAAFNTANTDAAAITVIQGTNTTQNTNIAAVNTLTGSAYATSNTGAAAITVIQGVNAKQNTDIISATTLAQTAFNYANTVLPVMNTSTTFTDVTLGTKDLLTSGNVIATGLTTVDSFSSNEYRSAKYEVQMTSGTSYHVIEVRVVTDGNNAWLTQYGDIHTGDTLGTISGSMASGIFSLTVNPVTDGTVVRFYRSALKV